MQRFISVLVFGLLLTSGRGLAHPNPEIARVQERRASGQFTVTPEDLGIVVAGTEILLPSSSIGHAIRKPLPSPDGKRVAFTNPEEDILYLLDPESRETQTVTAGPGVGSDFMWASSSGELVYRRQKEKQRQDGYEIWCFNPNADSPALQLSMGEPLRLVPIRETGDVWVTDTRGQLFSRTPGSARDEELSPVVDLRGQVVRLRVDEDPHVLSDSDEQCFDVQHKPHGEVFIYSNLDTLRLRNAGGELVGELGYGIHPRWAPDGSCIVYQVSFDDGHTLVKSELAVSSPDGLQQAMLTATDAFDEVEPAWLPDGLALLCACEKTGNLLKILFVRSPIPVVQGEP